LPEGVSHVNHPKVQPDDTRILARDYRLSLEAENKTATTIAVYGSAIERFAEWLEAKGRPTSVTSITR
jgi:hypothetical protein